MGCRRLRLRFKDRHVSRAEDFHALGTEKTEPDSLKSGLQNMRGCDDEEGGVDRNENAAPLQQGLRTVVIKDRNSMVVNMPAVAKLIGSVHGARLWVFGGFSGRSLSPNNIFENMTEIVPA